MDIQCPAAVTCLAPGEVPPKEVGGQRVVAAYLYDVPEPGLSLDLPIAKIPSRKFWDGLQAVADSHRGEAVVVYASNAFLDESFLRGASLIMSSDGPQRL